VSAKDNEDLMPVPSAEGRNRIVLAASGPNVFDAVTLRLPAESLPSKSGCGDE
jgi:hypothetical protein